MEGHRHLSQEEVVLSSRSHTVWKIVIGAVLSSLALSLPEYFRTSWIWLHHSATTLFALQPSEEPPISDLFVVFLAMFVMMGLMPLFDKLVIRISKYLKTRGQPDVLERARVKGASEELYGEPEKALELYDFEIILLRDLAQAGWKGLSLKHITAELHLEPLFTEQTLTSLQNSGLVLSLDIVLFGKRFFLTRKGREYSKRQGLISSF